MKFIKWPSIENSYRGKHIAYFRALFPSIDDREYIITEKLHGANLSVHFAPGEDWRIAKRTGFIGADEQFYGVQALVEEKYRVVFDDFQEHIAEKGEIGYILYGELFGSNIQKGVDYGPDKRILFFGMRMSDEFVPFCDLAQAAKRRLLGDHIVPILGIAWSLQDALDFDTELISKVGTTICEGAVIQPLNRVFLDKNNSVFILKKKNKAFLETHKVSKPRRPLDTEVARLQNEVAGYVTKMRLRAIFSKCGEITMPNEIGAYIKFMIVDVTEDFTKDFPEFADFTKGQRGQVMKVVGKLTANLIQGFFL